jgi:hypothetical protein
VKTPIQPKTSGVRTEYLEVRVGTGRVDAAAGEGSTEGSDEGPVDSLAARTICADNGAPAVRVVITTERNDSAVRVLETAQVTEPSVQPVFNP